MNCELNRDNRYRLLQLARETIQCQLRGMPLPRPDRLTPSLEGLCGAFVTLHKNGDLRGCIGNLEGRQSLWKTIQTMALAAAFEDPRFPPVSLEEWSEITIEISVLSPLTPATPDEVIPGTHGIVLGRGLRRGVLLPQVAVEQGWDRETFLTHGCYKAGLPGNAWREPETSLEIFKAAVFGEADE